jgi:hypothetical protein
MGPCRRRSSRPTYHYAWPGVVSSLVASARLAIAVCECGRRRTPDDVIYPPMAGAARNAWA